MRVAIVAVVSICAAPCAILLVPNLGMDVLEADLDRYHEHVARDRRKDGGMGGDERIKLGYVN